MDPAGLIALTRNSVTTGPAATASPPDTRPTVIQQTALELFEIDPTGVQETEASDARECIRRPQADRSGF